MTYIFVLGFPGSSVVKNLPTNAGNTASVSGSTRSPGEGNGNPLQFYCLGNHMDRGAWWATVHAVTNRTLRVTIASTETATSWARIKFYPLDSAGP